MRQPGLTGLVRLANQGVRLPLGVSSRDPREGHPLSGQPQIPGSSGLLISHRQPRLFHPMQDQIQASPAPDTWMPRLEAVVPDGSLFVPYSHRNPSEPNVSDCAEATYGRTRIYSKEKKTRSRVRLAQRITCAIVRCRYGT